jgi:diguanylate cyclase (GGDEF)-like protein
MEQKAKVAILAREVLAVLSEISKQKHPLSLPLLQRQLLLRSRIKHLFYDSPQIKQTEEPTLGEADPPRQKGNGGAEILFENQYPLETVADPEATTKIDTLKRVAATLAIVAKRDSRIVFNKHLEEIKQELKKEYVDSERLEALLSSIKEERLRLDEDEFLSTKGKSNLKSSVFLDDKLTSSIGEESLQWMEIYRTALERFAEQLYIPEGDSFASRANALVSKLAEPLSWPELQNTEQEIHALLADFLEDASKQKDKLIDLLHEVAVKLVETEKEFILSLITDHKSRQDVEEKFQQALVREVSDIGNSFTGSRDLDEIQALVFSKLSAIREAMVEKKTVEHQRLKETERKITKLQKRLGDNQKQLVNIQRVAEQDPLTGIPNRRALWRRLAEQLERYNRYREQCSFIMMDVDHFKEVNDQYGHLNGDNVLQTIGQRLKDRLRKTDFFARYGGDEFSVILPYQELKEARLVAEELRKTVKLFEFIAGEAQVHVTLSLGVSEFKVGDHLEDVIKRADEALYKAKQHGRDCVESA